MRMRLHQEPLSTPVMIVALIETTSMAVCHIELTLENINQLPSSHLQNFMLGDIIQPGQSRMAAYGHRAMKEISRSITGPELMLAISALQTS